MRIVIAVVVLWVIFFAFAWPMDRWLYGCLEYQWVSSLPVQTSVPTKQESIPRQETNLSLDLGDLFQQQQPWQAAACRRGEGAPAPPCRKNESCSWRALIDSWFNMSQLYGKAFADKTITKCHGRCCCRFRDFPKPVCSAVSPIARKFPNMSIKQLWPAEDRSTLAGQRLFYQEYGLLVSIRMAYHETQSHYRRYCRFLPDVPRSHHVLEYGAGGAAFSYNMVRTCGKMIGRVSLVDVAAEHLFFGAWRIRYAHADGGPVVQTYIVNDATPNLNLQDAPSVLILRTVLEHLPNPFDVMVLLLRLARPGCILIEDYCTDGGQKNPENLVSSAEQRPQVFNLLRTQCRLLDGTFQSQCGLRTHMCNGAGLSSQFR